MSNLTNHEEEIRLSKGVLIVSNISIFKVTKSIQNLQTQHNFN